MPRVLALGLMICAFCASCAGCLVIPIFGTSYTGGSRRNIEPKIMARIIPGKTTIEDTLLMLGEPDETSPDETSLTYRTTTLKAIVGIMYAGRIRDIEESNFVVNLDTRGVVASTKVDVKRIARP